MTDPRVSATVPRIPAPRQGARVVRRTRATERYGRLFVALIIGAWMLAPVIGFEGVVMVLTAAGLAATVIGVWRPVIGLYGITIVCVLDAVSRVYVFTGGVLRYNTLNYWLLLALLLFAPAALRTRNIHFRLVLALLVLLTLELGMSERVAGGMEHVLNGVSVLALTIYFVRAARRPAVWYWVGVLGGVLGALTGLAFQLYRTGLPPINPNAWATFGVTALFAICLAYPAGAQRRRGQPILLALASASLLWVFLSGSRGNTFIALCCALFLILCTRGLRARVAGLAMAIVVALAVWSQFPALREAAAGRLEKLFDEDASLSNRTSGRSDLARGGWAIFREEPLGIGTGEFSAAWRDVSDRDPLIEYGRGTERDAHSGWIKILAENGVPGVMLMLAYVCSFGLAGLRRRDPDRRRLGLLVTVALGVAFLTTEFQPKGLWFLAAGGSVLLSAGLRPEGRSRARSSPGSV